MTVARNVVVVLVTAFLAACGGNASVGRDGTATGGAASTTVSPNITVDGSVIPRR